MTHLPTTIYLDYAATTPVHSQVVEVMAPLMAEQFGNAHSLHRLGRESKKHLESARAQLAKQFHVASPENFIFTSGGTESNNLAIKGLAFALQNRGRHLITSGIEHPSVLETVWW